MPRGSYVRIIIGAGQKFGRWTVVGPETRVITKSVPSGYRAFPVRCSCESATERVIALGSLTQGKSLSCGCRRSELIAERNRISNPALTHGMTNHPLFDTWRHMLERCENPARKDWKNWGGRGISVCEAWHDVAAFTSWVDSNLGQRPEGMTFDRTDNDGNYEPGNVRWATRLQQSRNRRQSKACGCGELNPGRARFCFMCGERFPGMT